jgi:hypothetical protein
VSKNFQGTIQNDNLPSGNLTETWFQKPTENNNNQWSFGHRDFFMSAWQYLCRRCWVALYISAMIGGKGGKNLTQK